jgi:hypothetical protein
MHEALARHLVGSGLSYSAQVLEGPRTVTDTLAVLASESGQVTAWLHGAGRLLLSLPEAAAELVMRSPGALWLLNFQEGCGTAQPFAPPRVEELDGELPVYIPEDVTFNPGRDLLSRCRVGDSVVFGQRSLLALGEDDSRSITLWQRDGKVLHLELADHGDGEASLHLVAVLDRTEARRAPVNPNALLRVGPRARLVPSSQREAVALSRLQFWRPRKSDVLSAWARYAALTNEASAEMERKRGEHDLRFSEATQVRQTWEVRVQLDPEAQEAWLGSPRGERRVRIGQPVQLVGGDSRFTVESGRLLASGLARLLIKGKERLPPSGVLETREDIGRKTDLERKQAAAERLSQGRAACPELPHLLANPGLAQAPEMVSLVAPVVERLDGDQSHAVRSILGCRDLYLLQGPPGTGKTRVILEALRQLDAMGRRRGKPFRILVSSVQNEAVKNVAERLDRAGGSLIRVVQRRPRDDDERAARAQQALGRRTGVIAAIRERLQGHRIAQQLEPIEGLRREVEAVAAMLTMGAEDRTRAGLGRLAERDLMDFALRQEARRLSTLEDALELAAGAAIRLPELPVDLPAWWGEAASHVAPERRAALAMLVAQVEQACALPEPRRTRRLGRRWAELAEAWNQLPASAGRSEPKAAWKPMVEAWLATARRHVQSLEDELRGSPEGVAWTFLQVLESDNRAWDRLVERHSSSVAATCSMSGKVKDEPQYDWVIIDEAGRANPFELLIPMVQGQRVVLIGDHRQLPPMVDDELLREVETEGLDIRYTTLFSELYDQVPGANRGRLGTQYRMHGDIGELVNQAFYAPNNEHLRSHFSGELSSERRTRLGLFEGRAAVFYEVPGRGQHTEDNPDERRAVLDLLGRYLEAGAEDGEVAVIVPYQAQREALEAALSRRPDLRRISQLLTIDASQGHEYPVVLMCTTRTNGSPGFLASPNRINVALSRAQEQLVLVGRRGPLSTDHVQRRAPHLKQVLSQLPTVTP